MMKLEKYCHVFAERGFENLFEVKTRRRFRADLLRWYDQNKRDLPWRQDHDAYRIWTSEIMLQQTRVSVVVEYYSKILERFPSIEKLAGAREASVLAAWSGLGYYRRARMMRAAAKKIVNERGGEFPKTAAEIRSLPGIGRYTAAAIASIAWNEPVAAVDGNVERVIQRLAGKSLTGNDIWAAAQNTLDAKRPGDFNQAMMELGATVCLPKAPRCLSCPVAQCCRTHGELRISTNQGQRKKQEVHYELGHLLDSVFLVKRSDAACLMPGFWELPQSGNSNGNKILFTVRHSITVTDYTVRVGPLLQARAQGKWIPKSGLSKLPLTGLTRKILRRAEII